MNKKSTKKALLMSALSLLMCVSMLVGTTFAWFTDEVVSGGNIIQSGTLDAGLYYGDKADAVTNDASNGAIFDYKYWEPGYTQIKYVKITNEGNLAFKFQLNIIPDVIPVTGDVNLAEVIDVYMFEAGATVNRETIAAATPVGTLKDLMVSGDGAAFGYLLPAEGVGTDDYNEDVTAPRGEITYCIALKMRESAGNEYQNLSVGNGFTVQLLATQYTWEKDHFDHLYDDDAEFPPKANVNVTGPQLIDTSTHGLIYANATFQFQPTESYAEAQQSPYRYYHADYVVSADHDIPGNAVILPGYYTAYCDNYNEHKWIGLSTDETISAGTEIRLVHVMGQGSISVNYEEICNFGNDGTGFLCGVSDQSNGALNGTTLTVELRVYETYSEEECLKLFGYKSKNEETGKHFTIGTYTYTFGEATVGGDATLSSNIKTSEIVNMDGGTLNGNGNTITSSYAGTGTNAAIQTTGGTIENLKIENGDVNAEKGLRAVYVTNPASDLYIDNCQIDATYCININSSTNTHGLYVSNSTLNGWTSYGSVKEAVFTNCSFGKGSTGYANLRPYGDTELKGCSFSEGFTITRNSTEGEKFTIELTNCNVNGVAVTADNFVQLLAGEQNSYSLHDCTWITVIVNGVEVAL